MPSSVDLLCIEPGQLTAAAWPCVRDMIRKALVRTGLGDFDLLEQAVLDGRQLLWMAWNGEWIEAAATTELGLMNGEKLCFIRTCSGSNFKRWVHHIEQIEAYARAEGCARIRITGRKGWERSLDGYHARYAVMDKELSLGRFQPNHQPEQPVFTLGCGHADGEQPVRPGEQPASEQYGPDRS